MLVRFILPGSALFLIPATENTSSLSDCSQNYSGTLDLPLSVCFPLLLKLHFLTHFSNFSFKSTSSGLYLGFYLLLQELKCLVVPA